MTKVVSERQELVKMNNKNEKHFSTRLNMQMCELLQVLTKANNKKGFENKCSWNSKTQ